MSINIEKQAFIDAIEKIENESSCTFQYGYIVHTGEGHVVVQNVDNIFIDIEWTTPIDAGLSVRMRTEEQEAAFREYIAAVDGDVIPYEELLEVF